MFTYHIDTRNTFIHVLYIVQVIHSVFNNASGAQQDVSEFTHKLLEWMEDAFLRSLGDEK